MGEEGVRIKTMEIDEDAKHGEWLVLDDGQHGGGLWKVNWREGMSSTKLIDTHSGPVLSLDASPNSPFVATAGMDGTVRLLDTVEKKQIYMASFTQPATTLQWAPK